MVETVVFELTQDCLPAMIRSTRINLRREVRKNFDVWLRRQNVYIYEMSESSEAIPYEEEVNQGSWSRQSTKKMISYYFSITLLYSKKE